MEELVGRTLGRYEITALIGRGGMATVYKARHPGLNRTVAVKVLHHHLAVDSAFVGRFRREARAVAALRHPNIVRVHDFDNEGDIYFIVMEFIDGPTLASFLKRVFRQGRHLSPQEVLRLFSPVCSAIGYAHQRGMVHRDIKPSNIILTREQEPIVTDYGIARIAGATAYTIPGVVMGSTHYMSPEQAEGLPGDNRSDIYSLGIVLFEALTGSVPFQGETPLSIAIKHVSATPPRALSLNPDLPPAIEAVLAKALAKDPNDRYQQASDLALALQEIFGQAAESAAVATGPTTVEEPTVKLTREITPPPPSAGEPTRVVEPTVVAEPGPTIPPAPVRGAPSKLPKRALIAGAAAAVVAVALAWPFLLGGGGGSSQPAASTSTSTHVATGTQGLGRVATPIATAAAIATSTGTHVAPATQVLGGLATPGPAAGGPLKIGLLLDYTGSLAEFGPNIETGARLAAKQINDAGGVLGQPIQLVKADSGTNPQVAVEAAKVLVNVDRVQAIVGSLSSGVTLAAAEGVAIPNKIIMISPSGTSPGLTSVHDDDFLFRTVLSDAAQGVVLADWAWEQGYKKVATFYTNNAYGKGLSDQFVKSFEAKGGTVTAAVSHEQQQTTYLSELQLALAGSPDALACMSYPAEGKVYIKEAIENNLINKFLFVDGTKSQDIINAVGAAALEGTTGTSPSTTGKSELTAAFDADCQGEYGKAVPALPYIREAYDAVVAVALAAEAAQSTDTTKIRDQLRAVTGPPGEKIGAGAAGVEQALSAIQEGTDIDFEGAASTINWDDNGDILTGDIEIFKITGGAFQTVKVVPVSMASP